MHKIIFFTFMLMSVSLLASEQDSYANEKDIILAVHNLWEFDTYDVVSKPISIDAFVKSSKEAAQKIKQQKEPHGFKLSERGLTSLKNLIDQTIRIYEAAQSASKDFNSFHEVVEHELIGLRQTVLAVKAYDDFHKKVGRAASKSIDDILKKADVTKEGTAIELRFVYSFIYAWEDFLVKQEAQKPSQSGEEYIQRAEQALRNLVDQFEAPSGRSSEVAVFIIEQLIKILKTIDRYNKDLHKFIELSDKSLTKVFDALEQGLLDRSLKKIKKNVEFAAKKEIEEISRGKQSSLFGRLFFKTQDNAMKTCPELFQ